MASSKTNRKPRKECNDFLAQLVDVENQLLDEATEKMYYKSAWEAEKLMSESYRYMSEKNKQRLKIFVLLFWATFAVLILSLFVRG